MAAIRGALYFMFLAPLAILDPMLVNVVYWLLVTLLAAMVIVFLVAKSR